MDDRLQSYSDKTRRAGAVYAREGERAARNFWWIIALVIMACLAFGSFLVAYELRDYRGASAQQSFFINIAVSFIVAIVIVGILGYMLERLWKLNLAEEAELSEQIDALAQVVEPQTAERDWREEGHSRLDYSGGNLRHARIIGGDLHDAILPEADMVDADLRDSNLTGADLSGANLKGADLRGAILWGGKLSRAVMQKVRLEGTDLRKAVLVGVDLTDAVYNSETKWPSGFDPGEAGARQHNKDE